MSGTNTRKRETMTIKIKTSSVSEGRNCDGMPQMAHAPVEGSANQWF